VTLAGVELAPATNVGLFMAATLVLNATPGVDLLLTVTRTLQAGPRAGVAAALGINAGCLVHAAAAAFGLAALLAVSGTAFAAFKWAGAAYLLWLAWGLARSACRPAGSAVAVEPAPARSAWQDFRSGLLTNVLNPKVALFFLAFLPQFVAPGATSKGSTLVLLVGLFLVQSTLFLLLVVAVAARAQRLPASAAARRWLQGAGAGLFAALALRLAVTRHPAG
jgi:threonine/homoserine/homoserine lactone efflux protein